jgi:hypothetical protein
MASAARLPITESTGSEDKNMACGSMASADAIRVAIPDLTPIIQLAYTISRI